VQLRHANLQTLHLRKKQDRSRAGSAPAVVSEHRIAGSQARTPVEVEVIQLERRPLMLHHPLLAATMRRCLAVQRLAEHSSQRVIRRDPIQQLC
jgi:hypothetical protein